MEHTKYVMACDFKFIKAEDILAERDLIATPSLKDEHILYDILYHRTYLINESIYNFLQLFTEPITFGEVLNQLQVSLEDESSIRQLQDFFHGLKKKQIIVSQKVNESIEKEIEEQESLPKIEITDYDTVKVFKQTNDIWVALLKGGNEELVVVKKLLLTGSMSKKMKEKYIAEFAQEFAIMRELSEHPAICKLLSYNDINHEAYLEYIEGVSLRSYAKENKLPLSKCVDLIDTLLSSFSFMQSKNVVHGDIHASNFMIDKNLNLRIIDFGMSNHLKLQENEVPKTGGAHYYIPPERLSTEPFKIMNRKKTDFYAENYQLGIIMFYVFYGKTPHEGFTWKALVNNIMKKDIIFEERNTSGEIIPTEVIHILKKALDKIPENRYADAGELYKAWKIAVHKLKR